MNITSQVIKARALADDRGGGPDVRGTVETIIADVRRRGDSAVREYSERFDQWSPDSFRLSEDEIARCLADVPAQVLEDLRFCQTQVRTFAEAQRATLTDLEI